MKKQPLVYKVGKVNEDIAKAFRTGFQFGKEKIRNDKADIIYKKGYNDAIKEFIKDLKYIETISIPSNSSTNVFLRIDKIKDKWEKQ